MDYMPARCELCGRTSICADCAGLDLETAKHKQATSARENHIVHVVSGTPSQVTGEWSRLAKEDSQPS